ncbi:putative reverse transcriptase domain-containing protein [Tanacetum coccineum]
MMNYKGFFFFKFDTSKGLEDVLENGPWMIRNNPIILKKWTMHTRPLKEELTRILVWVKIHDVPLQVFFEDGAALLDMVVNKRKNGKTGTSSNSNNRNGVKIDGHSGKLNVKYVPKAAPVLPTHHRITYSLKGSTGPPPVPQDEDEREPMFVHAHDPDYVPEPIYPEYIPLEDEHEFPAEEQPLPPVDSPTAESPGYVTESDPKEDLEEYEDDEIEDGRF